MPRGRIKYPLSVMGGVREDLNPVGIPDGRLLSALNLVHREGQGRPRPGYIKLFTTADAKRVIGIGFRGSSLAGNNVIIHTTDNAYLYDGSSASSITGTWTVSTATQLVRFAPWFQGTTTYVIRVNDANAPFSYSGAGNFTTLAGSPPAGARDITVSGGRVILFRAGGNPYRVQWSGFNDMGSWGVNDLAELKDTPGEVTAGRALGPNTFAVYKEDALYVATEQAALVPFQFQFVAHVPGPVSAAALVNLQGVHYWLAEDGNIYRFDGSSPPQPMGKPVEHTLKTTLSIPERKRSWSFSLSVAEPEVWWGHFGAGTTNTIRGLSINTAIGNEIFPHQFTHEISAAAEWVTQSDRSFDGLTSFASTIDGLSTPFASIDAMSGKGTRTAILGDANGNVYRFGDTFTDDTTNYSWEFEHGWKAIAEADNRFYLDAIVSYWEKISASVTVTLTVTVTDSVGDAESSSTGTFDLSTDSNHKVAFVGLRGKWIKVKHSIASASQSMEHRGSAVLCWKRGMV